MEETTQDTKSTEYRCPLCMVHDAVMTATNEFRSSKTGRHLKKSRKELLLAVRSMLDTCIEHLVPEEEEEETITRVEVD